MPRGAAAYDLVARGTRRASGVPRHSALDTLHPLKDCLHAPEAATSEDGGLLARASGVGGSGGEVLAHHRAAGDHPSERHGRGEQRQTTTESASHRGLHIGTPRAAARPCRPRGVVDRAGSADLVQLTGSSSLSGSHKVSLRSMPPLYKQIGACPALPPDLPCVAD